MRVRSFLLLLVIGQALSVRPAAQGNECPTARALSEEDVQRLIAGRVAPARLRQLVLSCGLSFANADDVSIEATLQKLGAPALVIAALAPPADGPPGTRWTAPLDRREMTFIPAGTFQMGSPATETDREADEGQHPVRIDRGFWIDAAEVSNEAFRRFVVARPEWQKDNIRRELHDGNYLKTWQGTSYPDGGGDQPVVWVSWHAARAYATWAGKRLPSESEWEYAARAGTSTRYWWGDAFDKSRVVNPWGLRDAIGGVWELTSSLYRPYPFVAGDGRQTPLANGPRVVRGGSSANAEKFLRVANRNVQDASDTSDLVGFRCAR